MSTQTTPNLVPLISLPLGAEFRTAITALDGAVIDKPKSRGGNVLCVIGESDYVRLHPALLVIPTGNLMEKRSRPALVGGERRYPRVAPCASMERFRVHVDEDHDMACCKAVAVPYGMGTKVHAAACCSDPECGDCDERLVEARSL
jgi:hypothetical protein